MNQVDKISREVLNLLNYSKDVTSSNLNTANNSGRVDPKLSDEQLISIVNIVEASLSQGYQKALNSFQKNVKNVLTEKTQPDAKKRK